MGTLRDLKSNDKTVHLLTTNSNKAEIFVYDELKARCNATIESVYEVTTKSEFNSMLELVNVQPYLSDKWLFVINYSKLKTPIKNHKGFLDSVTSVFLVKVQNYKEYKEFKELYPTCNDMYLTFMRRNEVSYLFTGLEISPKLVEFISRSYPREPDKIFTIRESLIAGEEVKSSKDIVKVCGASAGSIVHLVFLLLAEGPKTERGLNMVYKKRIAMATDLIEAYGVRTFKNFLTATVRDFIYIKELYMNGVIYDSIRDLPEAFDEKQLSRYNFQLKKITTELTYSKLINLYLQLKESGYWTSKNDMVAFMYNYYKDSLKEVINEKS